MRIFERLIPFIILLTVAVSCKKETFNHETKEVVYDSVCDSMSPQITGTYTGTFYKMGNHSFDPGQGFHYDTISVEQFSITVDRIYPNYNSIADSLYCFYQMDTFYTTPFYITDYSPTQTVYSYGYNRSLRFNLDEGTLRYSKSVCMINCESSYWAVYLPVENFVLSK